MSTDFGRRVAGAFNDHETRALRDAYRLALYSLAMTHAVDEDLKARLADTILRIFVTETLPERRNRIDVGTLASRGVDRYLTFANLARIGEGETFH